MILKDFVLLMQDLAQDLGYEFYVGAQRKINSTIKELPAAWMELPTIKSVDGLKSGEVTYSVSMYLLQRAFYSHAIEQCDLLHSDAVVLCNNLALCDVVRSVEKLEVEVDYFLFAPLSDATAHLEFEVTLDYDTKNLSDDNSK